MIRFLLIDDDEVFNFLNTETIRLVDEGYKVEAFSSGIDALSYLHGALAANEPLPDVILLDIRMPGMTGFEFLDELLKGDTQPFEHTAIYVVSSTLDPRDIDKANQYTLVQGFRSKPLTEEAIAELIAHLPPRKRQND